MRKKNPSYLFGITSPLARLSGTSPAMGMAAARPESGMVLVLTLWVLAGLSLLLLTLFQSANLLHLHAGSLKNEVAADAVGRGAVIAVARELANLRTGGKPEDEAAKDKVLADRLARGEELGFYLVSPGDWKVERYDKGGDSDNAGFSGRDYAVCQVLAEDAKAQINRFEEGNWVRVPGVSPALAAGIMEYVSKHGKKLACVEQVLVFPEIRGKIFQGHDSGYVLSEVLTTFSDGKLYLNRASAPAIATALDMDMEQAENIAKAIKDGHYFLSAEALTRALGPAAAAADKLVSLVCNSYRIKVFSIIGGRVHRHEAVVVFTGKKKFEIAYLREV